MSRRTRTRSSIAGFALLFLAVPMWWSMRTNASTHTPPDVLTRTSASAKDNSGTGGFVIPPDFPTTLIRVGLDPAALTAAGVASGSITSVLQAAADTINANPNAIPNADTAFAAARVSSDRLRALVQSGLASQDDLTAYQTAGANLVTATSQRQTAMDQVFTTAIANLTAGQRTLLTQLRTNRSRDFSRDYPMEFLVIDRQETEWVNLRDCLANEHIAIRYPETLDQGAQSQLATWRADPTVSAAKNSLDANLPAVTTAWNTAAGVVQ